MYSKDFKKLSLSQLRNKWGSVIIAMLIAILVVYAISLITQIPNTVSIFIQNHTHGIISAITGIIAAVATLVLLAAQVLVSGCISYGVGNYQLHFVRHGETNISYIFSGFSYGGNVIKRSFILFLLTEIFVFLWSLLLIIPGIIAALSYSQAFYILIDDDNMSASEALKLSKKMMKGYKGRLFCLGLSFIGWILLCCLTFGIGFIFLAPYIGTAYANFYEYLRGIYENSKNVY